MRRILFALAVGLSFMPAIALAEATTSAATQTAGAHAFSTETSTINEILANPQAKAVLDANLPEVSQSQHMDMIGGMTLKQLQGFSADRVTDMARHFVVNVRCRVR